MGTVRQTLAKAVVMGLLVLMAGLAGAVSFAPAAAAKGQEGGVVCTGPEMASHTCQPAALASTPIGSMPLGCQPSSGDTVACGRRGFHVSVAPGFGPADVASPATAGGAAGRPAK